MAAMVSTVPIHVLGAVISKKVVNNTESNASIAWNRLLGSFENTIPELQSRLSK
ncbi:MAG: hypothetical protein ABI813_04290 [Bacteroidota bacterium]